jgi:hypothetical protein
VSRDIEEKGIIKAQISYLRRYGKVERQFIGG